MTPFDAAIARMRELAEIENLRAGLNVRPRLPELARKPSGYRPKAPTEGGASPARGRARVAAVEERHHKVATMLLAGVPQREIAERLGVKTGTVKSDACLLRQRGVV